MGPTVGQKIGCAILTAFVIAVGFTGCTALLYVNFGEPPHDVRGALPTLVGYVTIIFLGLSFLMVVYILARNSNHGERSSNDTESDW